MAGGRTLAVTTGSRMGRSKPYWRNQEMGWWSEDDPSGSLMDTRERYGEISCSEGIGLEAQHVLGIIVVSVNGVMHAWKS